MGELGSGTGSSFPGSLDTDSTLEVDSPAAGKTKARANVPNDLAAAIIAIQTELGTDPAGSSANVKTRLAVEHNDDGTHSLVTTSSGIISGGHALWLTDITHDIGASGIRRPRDIYARDLWLDGQVRGNLTVSGLFLPSSGTYSGAGSYLRTKLLEIGDWNMDATDTIAISHALTFSKIRGGKVLIRNDADTTYHTFPAPASLATGIERFSFTASDVEIARAVDGFFDSTAYDSTSFNRGWVIIDYAA